MCWSNVNTSSGDQLADSSADSPTLSPDRPFTHTEVLKGCELWLPLGVISFLQSSVGVSSHRFRPSDHMCVNERSMVATISGGNNQWRRSLLCLDGCSLHAMTMLCYVCSQGSFPCCCFSFSIKMCVCTCVCVRVDRTLPCMGASRGRTSQHPNGVQL